MLNKITILLLIATVVSFASLALAGEMEIFSPIMINMNQGFQPMDTNFQWENKLINNFQKEMERSFRIMNMNQGFQPMDLNSKWENKLINNLQKEMERVFMNSVSDPSNMYVIRKLENDVLKGLNTGISVGSAFGGNPISIAGAVKTVISNYGPQEGPIQNATGRVGDVIKVVNVFRSANDIINGRYSEAGLRLFNTGLGTVITEQKQQLREPITISAYKQIPLKYDDGFTKIEGMGSVSVTKTYTPPKTIRPIGPPDIFEGSTTIIKDSNWNTKIITGYPNNKTSISIPNINIPSVSIPNLSFPNISTPSFNSINLNSGFSRIK
jgi:hypothetical protein